MATIYVTEDQLALIKESSEEVTFYRFFIEVKNYMKDLLNDPIEAKPSEFFSKHGISKSTLLNKLLERGIVNRKETIDEPTDADGNITSSHTLQYSIPRKNFELKLHRLYSYFFERS